MIQTSQGLKFLCLIKEGNINIIKNILQLAEVIYNIKEEWERGNDGPSFQINVIKSAAIGKLKENAHSRILHDLLKVKDEFILKSFLEEVAEIPDWDFNPDDVDSPDHNRIDLSIRSNDGFLIIENKVNSAEEQPSQIYRYYYEIALPQVGDESKIKILYLNPSNHDMPSPYSRSYQGHEREKKYEPVPENKIIVKDYKHNILQWLYKLINNETLYINKPLFEAAIRQYIDYLEDFFYIKEIYKSLLNKMEQEIINELKLNGKPLEEQVEIITSYIEKIAPLKEQLNKLKQKLLIDSFTQTLNEEFNGNPMFYPNFLDGPEINFNIIKEGLNFIVGIIKYGDILYWRIYSMSPLPEDKKEEITKLIPQDSFGEIVFGKDKDLRWDIYAKLGNRDINDIPNIARQLALCFKNN